MFDSPNKEIMHEQLNVIPRTLREDQLKYLLELARSVVKLSS